MTVKPNDQKLYDQVKKEADAKFLAKTSVYKSAWIIREYKKRNGTFLEPKANNNTGLDRWFKEKWVDLNRPGETCGRKSNIIDNSKNDIKSKNVYPLCRPTIKVTKDTPKLAQDIDKKIIKNVNKEKQKVKENGRISFVDK